MDDSCQLQRSVVGLRGITCSSPIVEILKGIVNIA